MPLKLDCYDEEEENLQETERESDHNEAATSEVDEPPSSDESTISELGSPITLGVDSNSTGPPMRPQSSTADMQLSGLQEAPTSKSADQPVVERNCEPSTHPNSVGATHNTFNMTRAAGSQQPLAVSRELATQEAAAQPDELITHRLPRRAATRQRQLIRDLIDKDLL